MCIRDRSNIPVWLQQRTLLVDDRGRRLGGEDADEIKRPEVIGQVEAVADDELVCDLEAHILAGDLDAPPRRLGEKRADLERGRLAAAQVLEKVAKRESGVDDVFDDEHVTSGDLEIQVLEDAHHAGRIGGRTVARHGHEEHRPLEHADKEDLPPLVVARDLGGEVLDPGGQLLAADEHLCDRGLHVSSSKTNSVQRLLSRTRKSCATLPRRAPSISVNPTHVTASSTASTRARARSGAGARAPARKRATVVAPPRPSGAKRSPRRG